MSRHTRYMLPSVRNGWVSSARRRSKKRKGRITEATQARERRGERESEIEARRYKAGVKRRVGRNEREEERRERTRSWVPCALVSGYTPYGSKRRYSGKFRVMQQQQQQQQGLSLSLFSLRFFLTSLPPASSRFFASPLHKKKFSPLLSRSALARRGCSFRFVSFFVSVDKPTVRSRRSRRLHANSSITSHNETHRF